MQVQERIEASDLGRVVISAFIVITLIVIFTFNLPYLYDSELKRQLVRISSRFVQTAGIDQAWSVFAPTPRQYVIAFRARITYADGSESYWEIPHYGPWIGAFQSTRWRKWVEVVWDQNYAGSTWVSTARWIARTHAKDGLRPVTVTFIRRLHDLWPPGSKKKGHPPWRQQEYFTYKVPTGLVTGA